MRIHRMLQLIPDPANEIAAQRFPSARGSGPDLSERLQRMEPAAWQDLYVGHHRLVRGIIAGHLGYCSDVEDVVQQVFLTALDLVSKARVSLTGPESGMRAWIAAIALRLAQSESCRRKKAGSVSVVPDGDALGSPPLDAIGRQLLARTIALLAKLPDRLRSPWILRHLECMSLEETAVCLGLSLATVKRRLAAADRRFIGLARRDAVLGERLRDGVKS
jgi:RNA polymerase sigma-70 factor, ECF subfamily